MHRSLKVALYGVVLAGVVGGTVAWATVDKTVTLEVDGQARTVHTVAGTVRGVLFAAGYQVGSHDIVAPPSTHQVGDGGQIVLKRGRLLHLVVDGRQVDVWTTAPTVADALEQLGYSTSSFSSVSRDKRLPLGPTEIELRSPKQVLVVADGRIRTVVTTDAKVSDVLRGLGLRIGAKDRLNVDGWSAPVTNETIILQRVKESRVVQQQTVPFATTTRKNPSAYRGVTTIASAGRPGRLRITWAIVYVDGKMAGKTAVGHNIVSPALARVIEVGTKAIPPSVPAGGGTPAAPVNVDPNSAQGIARALLAQRGWGDDQFSCLVQMWDRESGWRVNASNPSGAYGIPQALPGSKMSAYGADWETNPATQIKWGLGYISGRYSTPCGAWSYWQAHGWY